MAPVRSPVPVEPNHEGLPMRSVLTFGKALASCVLATTLSADLVRSETITWIDPAATRSGNLAESTGARSLDRDRAIASRGSLALLESQTPSPSSGAPATIELPLAVKTILSASDAVTKTSQPVGALAWMAVNVRPTAKGIDPYPTWSGAVLVNDDVTTVRDDRSYSGSYHASARSLDGKSFVMIGERFSGL